MELNSKKIFKILQDKGVDAFYHANSVKTSCTFLQQGSLLSRGTVEQRKLKQTPQDSDGIDKKFGIWFDIFLDAVDIHNRARKRNAYGPILFKINLDILNLEWLTSIWITKKNPTKWIEGEDLSNRYFQSEEEFKNEYKIGDFDSMFVFRHIGGVLPLSGNLLEIQMDKVVRETVDLRSFTYGALRASAAVSNFCLDTNNLKMRKCRDNCKCTDEYSSDLKKTDLLFYI